MSVAAKTRLFKRIIVIFGNRSEEPLMGFKELDF